MICLALLLPFLNSTGHFIFKKFIVDEFIGKGATKLAQGWLHKQTWIILLHRTGEGKVSVDLADINAGHKYTIGPAVACPTFFNYRHTVSVVVVIINLVAVQKMVREYGCFFLDS